ncbi:uncharacterized protein LOC120184986 [Hibiscus syriacus]|uniref:uncharacterized protein LOC120184986 n=1 Tax=Hibiscus syriacus TaxID=106335 RepID=UPI001924A703|nr:uncharacterized protein LOC120184986 [Hibiscus syriacus]
MIISFWNVRRLNNPLKQGQVLRRAAQNNVDILCLLETRVKAEKSANILATSFENWNVLTNYEFAVNGRIWFLWRNGLDFSLCNATDQSITVKGRFKNVPFIITAIYGSNNGITRRQLWQELRHLDSNFSDIPWLLGGDFNVILNNYKSNDQEFTGMFTSSDMLDFQEIIQDLQLHDHPYFGPTFSWSNKQMVDLHKEAHSNKPKPFKFFNCWTLHPGFLNIVSQSWSLAAQGNPMKSLFLKLKRLKVSLKQLNKDYFSDIKARRELKSLQEVEAMFLKQKAKLHWLKEGDKCTKLFHSIIATKNKRQTIRHIPSFEESETFVKEVTSDEIREVIFSQGNDKAPGPDGFTALFFKKAWPVVGNDFIKAIKYFFQESYIYPAFNATVIALIPKKSNPSKVSVFRPISCCSVIYKTNTKIIVNIITNLLPSIVDNTLLAQEIVKGYGRKNISPRCALKIDLQKAFDSINWDFIQAVLKALDLPPLVIAWIVSCYTDARYSISLNGSLVGYFKGAKGIRQGDPLSPTLFVLVMNVLSNILNNVAIRGIFTFHPKCKKSGLTHLSFADDLLIFCKGNLESIMGVITVLDCFYEFSGQLILPQSIIKKIEQLCSRFFWKGSDIPVSGARVSWGNICKPKSEGGLGLKDLKTWNKACLIHLTRKLLAGEGSLWVAWIHNYIIKQQDFFTMDEYPSATWSFRRMQKLSSAAQSLPITTTKSTKEIWEVIRHKDTKVH